MNKQACAVCLLAIGVPITAVACIYVNTDVALYHRYNPIWVNSGYGDIIDAACATLEDEINSNYVSYSWSIFVGNDPNVLNQVWSTSTVVIGSCTIFHEAGRIHHFEINWNPSHPWCFSNYPSNCVHLQYSFLDAMTHEIGHAIGLLHCNNIMSCPDFLDLDPIQQQEQFPTMVGADGTPDNCDYYGWGCGYIAPVCLMHTLSPADKAAISSLYYEGVVTNQFFFLGARRTGKLLTVDFSANWDPGTGIRIFWCDNQQGRPQQTDGEVYVLNSWGGSFSLDITLRGDEITELVWLENTADGLMFGPFEVEQIPDSEMNDTLCVNVAPNPFNPSTRIELVMPRRGKARLAIFDGHGRHVHELLPSTFLEADRYIFHWDGRDDARRMVAAGVYLVHVVAGSESRSSKLLLLK